MAENSTEKENNQFIDDVKDTVKNRLSNPVFFSYLFSWIIYNWDFISFMMFSNKTIEKKLTTYNEYISFWGWIVPIFGVVVYLIILNYIDIVFFKISKHGYEQKIEFLKQRSKIKIASEVSITKKKIALLKQQIDADEIDVLINERDRLASDLHTAKYDISEKNSTIKELEKKLEESYNHDSLETSLLSSLTNYKPNKELTEFEIEDVLFTMGLIEDFTELVKQTGTPKIFRDGLYVNHNIELYKRLGLVDKNSMLTLPIITDLGKMLANKFKVKYGAK